MLLCADVIMVIVLCILGNVMLFLDNYRDDRLRRTVSQTGNMVYISCLKRYHGNVTMRRYRV